MVYLALSQAVICFVNGGEYTANAVNQRADSVIIKNYRGKFLDRNLVPLVENTTAKVGIAEGREAFVPVRYAPDSLARHLIGYVDADGVGASGLEACFQDILAFKSEGRANVIRSADGKVLGDMGISIQEGNYLSDNVVLTIDSHIQRIAESALSEAGITGAAVVMDTQSFEVLAMASTPSYDQNNIQKYLNSNNGELINRCLFPYNAGSIFKIITMSAASEYSLLRSEYNCEGYTDVYDRRYNCHFAEGHGRLMPREALAKSCNCAFYTMGLCLGDDAVIAMAKRFGMGAPLLGGADPLAENGGNIPNAEETVFLDSINLAIGQGDILITPLQAANMACIIANGGEKKSVKLVREIQNSSGKTIASFDDENTERVISPRTCTLISEAMRLAVTDGTAKSLKDNAALISGKTGTAETGWIKNGKTLVHGWFCGFFPYDNPRYAMAVLAEDGGSGAGSALPVFQKIAEEIIKIYPLG